MRNIRNVASICILPDISLQQSEILGLEVGHDTSGHQGVVVRVEEEDYRQEEHQGVVKLEQQFRTIRINEEN